MRVTRLILLGTLALLLTVTRTPAQDSASYPDRELSMDLFGYWANQDKGGADKDAWGPGVTLNYFLNQNIGFKAETYSDAFTVPYLLNIHGVYRYPIRDTGFAPYGFAGVGRQWDHAPQWLGHLGGGVEWRVRSGYSLFADIRGVFPGDTDVYTMIRFGFKINLRKY